MSQVFGYPVDWKMKTVLESVAALARVKKYHGLDLSHVEKQADRFRKIGRVFLSEGFDGLGVFPKHSALARLATANEDWPV